MPSLLRNIPFVTGPFFLVLAEATAPTTLYIAFRGLTDSEDERVLTAAGMATRETLLVADPRWGVTRSDAQGNRIREARVHKGYHLMLHKSGAAAELLSLVSKLNVTHPTVTDVVLTGHGVGGALATLATDQLCSARARQAVPANLQMSLFTQGKPYVGDSAWAQAFVAHRFSGCLRTIHRDVLAYGREVADLYTHLPDSTHLPNSVSSTVSTGEWEHEESGRGFACVGDQNSIAGYADMLGLSSSSIDEALQSRLSSLGGISLGVAAHQMGFCHTVSTYADRLLEASVGDGRRALHESQTCPADVGVPVELRGLALCGASQRARLEACRFCTSACLSTPTEMIIEMLAQTGLYVGLSLLLSMLAGMAWLDGSRRSAGADLATRLANGPRHGLWLLFVWLVHEWQVYKTMLPEFRILSPLCFADVPGTEPKEVLDMPPTLVRMGFRARVKSTKHEPLAATASVRPHAAGEFRPVRTNSEESTVESIAGELRSLRTDSEVSAVHEDQASLAPKSLNTSKERPAVTMPRCSALLESREHACGALLEGEVPLEPNSVATSGTAPPSPPPSPPTALRKRSSLRESSSKLVRETSLKALRETSSKIAAVVRVPSSLSEASVFERGKRKASKFHKGIRRAHSQRVSAAKVKAVTLRDLFVRDLTSDSSALLPLLLQLEHHANASVQPHAAGEFRSLRTNSEASTVPESQSSLAPKSQNTSKERSEKLPPPQPPAVGAESSCVTPELLMLLHLQRDLRLRSCRWPGTPTLEAPVARP